MSAPVWLITGASNGFGLILCLRALEAGHRVIGSVRSKSRSSDAVASIESAGGATIEMDMSESQASITRKIQAAEAIHGRIDILVNNAGFSILGPAARFTEKEVHLQFETNVYGPIFAAQAVLPGMRARGPAPSGGQEPTIVNVSSVAGQDAAPTCALYAASKFALEGFSEALAREEAERGVRVLVVEPGGFRTNFLAAAVTSERGVGAEGDTPSGLLGRTMAKWAAAHGTQRGDPRKGAEVIFRVVTGEGSGGTAEAAAAAAAAAALRGRVLRLPLGRDAVERIEAKVESVRRDVEATRAVASGTDFSS